MSTAVSVLLFVIAVIAIVKYISWLTMTYLLEEEPRADEHHFIETQDGWRIRLSRYTPVSGEGEPVLLCHGAFGNQFNFTEPDGDSMVDSLVRAGYDCWCAELRGARSCKPPAGMSRHSATADDFLLYDLPAAIDYIRANTGYARVHWVGHSLGGMLLYAYELAHGTDALASGTTLGSPPGFDGVRPTSGKILLPIAKLMPGLFEVWLRAMAPIASKFHFSLKFFPINWNNVHPNFRAASLFNLIELMPPKAAEQLRNWNNGDPWRMRGEELDIAGSLNQLRLPLFVIYGESDPLVPLRNAQGFYDGLPTRDKQMLVLGRSHGHEENYNHVDLAIAKNGPADVYAPIAAWLAAHPVRDRVDFNDLMPMVTAPGAVDTSWRKALRRAAEVMNGMDDDARPSVVLTRQPAAKRKSAPKARAAAARTLASRPKIKTKNKAKKKSTATNKKPTATKKKSVAKSGANNATTKKKAAKKATNKTTTKRSSKQPAAAKMSTKAKLARKTKVSNKSKTNAKSKAKTRK